MRLSFLYLTYVNAYISIKLDASWLKLTFYCFKGVLGGLCNRYTLLYSIKRW